jgi:hypothetical protein
MQLIQQLLTTNSSLPAKIHFWLLLYCCCAPSSWRFPLIIRLATTSVELVFREWAHVGWSSDPLSTDRQQDRGPVSAACAVCQSVSSLFRPGPPASKLLLVASLFPRAAPLAVPIVTLCVLTLILTYPSTSHFFLYLINLLLYPQFNCQSAF